MKVFKKISVPLKYANNIEDLFINDKELKTLIISSKNKRKNFYAGSSVSKWKDELLISHGWGKTNKSLGDYFTINPVSKLPAWDVGKYSFNDLGINKNVVNVFTKCGFLNPTKVQVTTIPTLMTGVNTILGGETGGGKTLAYASPILNKLINEEHINESSSLYPKSIIMAPSWELCNQISKFIAPLAVDLKLNCTLFKSHKDIKPDIDIIVSTPHCLSIALKNGDLKIKHLKIVVLDESDMLLDKSFADVTTEVLSKLSIQTTKPIDGISVGSQLILANATCPQSVKECFGNYIPIESFSVLILDNMHKLIPNVSHKFIRSNKLQKSVLLITTLKGKGLNKSPQTIIFCNSKISANEVSSLLSENGIEHSTLHKDIGINERQQNFDKFQNGIVRVLVSTDLGARGLDTVKASQVINYEFPMCIGDYIHRAGRVGRVGSSETGKVINIISSRKVINAVKIIEKSIRLGVRLPNINTSRRDNDF